MDKTLIQWFEPGKGCQTLFFINNYLIFKLIYFLNEGMIYIFFSSYTFPLTNIRAIVVSKLGFQMQKYDIENLVQGG